jgi:hypothetical protein
MATSPSLFGGSMSPQEMQAQLLNQRAAQFAQMSPDQQLGMMAYKAGSGVGTGLAGAFGVQTQDPMIQRATRLRELAGQFNTNTADGLRQMADALRTTDPDMALQLSQRAAAMDLEASKLQTEQVRQINLQTQTSKTQAEQDKIIRNEAKDEALRTELAALPPEADDKAVEAVVRKYGKPDDIFKTLERRQTAEANRIAKAELEREKAETREREKQRDMEFKQQMAAATQANRSALTSVQRELAEARLADIRSKQADKTEKKEEAKQAAVNHAAKVINDVQTATGLVTGMTTGLVGKGRAFVPGNTAYDLQQQLLTLKANLGFDRLQQMRDASPTGGALGQVAVQELQALQATVGSLEIGQSKAELQKNLNKIENHYSNWIRATQGQQPLTLEQFLQTKQPQTAIPSSAGANTGAAAGAPAATGGWSIRPR